MPASHTRKPVSSGLVGWSTSSSNGLPFTRKSPLKALSRLSMRFSTLLTTTREFGPKGPDPSTFGATGAVAEGPEEVPTPLVVGKLVVEEPTGPGRDIGWNIGERSGANGRSFGHGIPDVRGKFKLPSRCGPTLGAVLLLVTLASLVSTPLLVCCIVFCFIFPFFSGGE